MKNRYLYLILGTLFLLCVALVVMPEVIHNSGDKPGENITESPKGEPKSGDTPTGSENNQTPTPQVRESKGGAKEKQIENTPIPRQQVPDERSDYDFSLRKATDPHYRWNAEKRCFDESNFPGQFEDRLGPEVNGYFPEWLSEVKLDNGCSFFFHPTQGRENAPIDPNEARG